MLMEYTYFSAWRVALFSKLCLCGWTGDRRRWTILLNANWDVQYLHGVLHL